MIQMQSSDINILKNLGFSLTILVGSKKIVDFIKSKTALKYPKITNFILPIGYIYGLYKSQYFMNLATSFPTHSFWKYLLDLYATGYGISYSFSLITFMIGYPTINLFFNMGATYLTNYINQYEGHFKELITAIYYVKDSLEKNKNWDVTLWDVISFKTWQKPIPIINELKLNEVLPLRFAFNQNSSQSKFIGTCNICYEEIDVKKLHRELPCQHVFHPECVDTWLLQCNATCPICRKLVYDK